MTENSLVNLQGISKPAEILVERFCDGVGGIFEPWQIRRIAKAEADADVMKAVAEIEKTKKLGSTEVLQTDVGGRALQRLVHQEVQNQINMEEILSRAINKLQSYSTPQNITDSFVTTVFERSKGTTDEMLQELWASLIAGEANCGGSISKKTLDVLASFEVDDAKLFQKLACFCYDFDGVKLFMTDAIAEVASQHGLNFDALAHLEHLGVIQSSLTGFYSSIQTEDTSKTLPLRGADGVLIIEFHGSDEFSLSLGNYLLTKAGMELARTVDAPIIDGAFQALSKDIMHANRLIRCPYP